jgi:Tfp pilus assembly protein PilV
MLSRGTASGFSLIEALGALALLLAGIAGGSLLLLPCVQYDGDAAIRRAAPGFAGSLAVYLRALRRDAG